MAESLDAMQAPPTEVIFKFLRAGGRFFFLLSFFFTTDIYGDVTVATGLLWFRFVSEDHRSVLPLGALSWLLPRLLGCSYRFKRSNAVIS